VHEIERDFQLECRVRQDARDGLMIGEVKPKVEKALGAL